MVSTAGGHRPEQFLDRPCPVSVQTSRRSVFDLANSAENSPDSLQFRIWYEVCNSHYHERNADTDVRLRGSKERVLNQYCLENSIMSSNLQRHTGRLPGLLSRLAHRRPRPRRGFHRSRNEQQFDLSALPDFESANVAMFTIFMSAVVVVLILCWKLMA